MFAMNIKYLMVGEILWALNLIKNFKFETLGRIFFWSDCSRGEQF